MSENKKESIYDEARRTVTEMNEVTDPCSLERGFIYTEGSYACGISLGEINLWNSENDDRLYNDDNDEYEILRLCIARKVSALAKELATIAKGIK